MRRHAREHLALTGACGPSAQKPPRRLARRAASKPAAESRLGHAGLLVGARWA